MSKHPYELARIQRACRHLAEAQAARDKAIRDAHAAGATIREIAAGSGLSVSRVGQLVAPSR